MALINRISRLFKADFHAVLDHIEEPEALLRQAIRDMEDDLAAAERRIAMHAHEQHALAARQRDLQGTITDIDAELDLCFESQKHDLAKGQIRKKLEAERLLKRLNARFDTNRQYLDEQRSTLEENTATLESLRQKAELITHRTPGSNDRDPEFEDVAWMARELNVSDDEIEIAYLREKSIRSAS